MSDSQGVVAVKAEIKEKLEDTDEEEIDIEESFWKECLVKSECSPVVKTETDNECGHEDDRDKPKTTAFTTAAVKVEADNVECGTSTSNIRSRGIENNVNKNKTMVKNQDSATRVTGSECERRDELTSESEYLSYISTKPHFMISEETNIDTEHGYERDETEMERGDEENETLNDRIFSFTSSTGSVDRNDDSESYTNSKSSSVSHEENFPEENIELTLKIPLSEKSEGGRLIGHKNYVNERPYKCTQCDKTFTKKNHFVEHGLIHTSVRPFHCDQCNKSFRKSSHLVIHKRIHTGEKPYKCDLCSKSFPVGDSLIKHKRIHTYEKPYKCEICEKSFSNNSNLIRHKRIHTGEKPYKCDQCNKSFTVSSSLTKHIRSHTGEKPYNCDLCSKSFTASNDLTKHKRIHTGEKPYKCELCSKSFADSSNLTRHKRNHTNSLQVSV